MSNFFTKKLTERKEKQAEQKMQSFQEDYANFMMQDANDEDPSNDWMLNDGEGSNNAAVVAKINVKLTSDGEKKTAEEMLEQKKAEELLKNGPNIKVTKIPAPESESDQKTYISPRGFVKTPLPKTDMETRASAPPEMMKMGITK